MRAHVRLVALGLTMALGLGAWAVPEAVAQTKPASASTADALPPGTALDAAPSGAVTVTEARAAAKVGERVTIRGRVVTDKEAFGGGRGTFTIESLPAPASDVKKATTGAESRAIIKLVDSSGKPIGTDLRNKGGLRAAAEVFIIGTISESKPGAALAINATGVYVPPPALPQGFFVDAMPENSTVVETLKAKDLKAGDRVAIRGRIGGSAAPFVDGRAVFTIVGPGIRACSEIPGDTCTKPWDYCCEPRNSLAAHTATIRITDGAGEPLRLNIKGERGIKELTDVVVVGFVSQVKKQALVVDAEKMYIAKP